MFLRNEDICCLQGLMKFIGACDSFNLHSQPDSVFPMIKEANQIAIFMSLTASIDRHQSRVSTIMSAVDGAKHIYNNRQAKSDSSR